MNVAKLIEEAERATGSGRLHESRDVVVRVEDPGMGDVRWLELTAVGIAFVNGRFVLQLAAGERDGQPGVHW